jgi:hypothetical protein
MKSIRKIWVHSMSFIHEKGLGTICNNAGAIALEYVLTMIVAGVLMTGVLFMFMNMAVQVIEQIKTIVINFP